MKKTSMSVTEAARNFADCINRARYQNVTFVLLKNGKPVARLVPDNEKMCLGRDLAISLLRDRNYRLWRRPGLRERGSPSDEFAPWHCDVAPVLESQDRFWLAAPMSRHRADHLFDCYPRSVARCEHGRSPLSCASSASIIGSVLHPAGDRPSHPICPLGPAARETL